MQSSLKKSLYLGLAALSFVAAAGVATSSADAATRATVKSDTTMTTAAADRNVTLTGTNAIYTKPGTVRGAKLVATTTTTARLANSKKSLDNFRAYRVAVTNRGSVYYKVVSFDGDYRGWVYGGKSTSAFAAGVKSYQTFTETTPSTTETANYYKFTTPAAEAGGKANYANAGKSVTYTQPAWTQYKVGRAITDSTDYANVKDLVISKEGTRTREGDKWVYVTSATHSDVNGWILFSSLTDTKEAAVPADKAVTVTFKTQDGTTVGTQVVATNTTTDTTTNNTIKGSELTAKLTAPAGYSLGSASYAATDVLKGGDKATVTVTKNAVYSTAAVNFVDGNFAKVADTDSFATSVRQALDAAIKDLNVPFGQEVSNEQLVSALTKAGLNSFTVAADGKVIAPNDTTTKAVAKYDLKTVTTPSLTGSSALLGTINAVFTKTAL